MDTSLNTQVENPDFGTVSSEGKVYKIIFLNCTSAETKKLSVKEFVIWYLG